MAAKLQRYIPNPLEDYESYILKLRKGGHGNTQYVASADFKKTQHRVRAWLRENIPAIQQAYPPDSSVAPCSDPRRSERDASIYTGAGGNAYLHWKLCRFYESEGDVDRSSEHLVKALEAVNVALLLAKRKSGTESGVAFYCGSTGVHTLAAILYQRYTAPEKVEAHLKSLLSYLPDVLSEAGGRHGIPDELLYGRAGYLSCLLLCHKYLPQPLCEQVELEKAMRKVFDCVLASGKTGGSGGRKGQASRDESYLHYQFYGTEYLGAAHGTIGILYILLQFPDWCREPAVQPWILSTLDHLLSTQLVTGNFPVIDTGRKEGELVHWCHGAPGCIPLLYRAHQVYNKSEYLSGMEAAVKCVWQRGVIKKGFGICHGIAGNAYFFLLLYRHTREEKYYYSALQFAEFVNYEEIKQEIAHYTDPQRIRIGQPDSPYSLMEGLAGTVCFFCDLLYPDDAAFPGYDGEF